MTMDDGDLFCLRGGGDKLVKIVWREERVLLDIHPSTPQPVLNGDE